MKNLFFTFLLLCLAVQAKEKERPQFWPLQIGEVIFPQMELALTNSERARGLMYRKELAEEEGMIFVFPQARVLHFWMKNTLIPLDVVFLNQQGVVLKAWQMPAQPPQRQGESEAEYESRLPYYSSHEEALIALEFRAGMIAQLGLQPGDKISLDIAKLQSLTSE